MSVNNGSPSISIELGKLKENIGKLWKSVDEMGITSKTSSDSVAGKLDEWIKTNRLLLESNQELLKAVVLNSQEVQRSSRSYEQGSQLLVKLQQQLESLRNATTELSETLEASTLDAVEGVEGKNNRLQPLKESVNKTIESLDQLQKIFSQRLQELEKWSQSNRQSLPLIQAALTQRDKLVMTGLASLSAIALVGLGVLLGIASKPKLVAGEAQHLTQDEVDALTWAQSGEGRFARSLMTWNNHKLSGLACKNDAARLGVTLKVDGRSAVSGFCTIWVEPPGKRKFSDAD